MPERDSHATARSEGASGRSRDAALACLTGAGVLASVALFSAAVVAAGPVPQEFAVSASAGVVASLAALGLIASCRRGGSLSVAYAADILAVLLVVAQVAIPPVGTLLPLAFLVLPLVHAASFAGTRGTVGLVVSAVALAVAVAAAAGEPVATVLALAIPCVLCAALVRWRTDALRIQRREIGEREAQARRLADEDGLTGLANYRAFWRALRTEVARAERHPQPFGLIVLDLDNFKRVNDEHGHLSGDRVLRAVAGALRRTARAEEMVCRQGGDEFAVIAIEAGAAEAESLARRLIEAVEESSSREALPGAVSASAGFAIFGQPARTAEALVEQAEAALRDAKHERVGRGAVHGAGAGPAPRSAGASAPGPDVAVAQAAAGRPGVRLAVTASLARALAAAATEEAIAQTAVAHAAGAIDAARVALYRQGRGERPVLAAISGGGEGGPASGTNGHSPVLVALDEHRPVVEPGHAAESEEAHEALHGAVLAIPLLSEGETLGALRVESTRPDAFAAAEVELLEGMGETVARALAVAETLAELATLDWEQDESYAIATARSDAHGREVARLADRIGRRLGLARDELRQLYLAALFHDIGTVCTPPTVLRKPGRLNDDEFAVLRPHPVVAYRLLAPVPGLAAAAEIVRAQRERHDGRGYPLGLAGDEIPVGARILHVCDAYVALTTTRPYRESVALHVALDEIRRGVGTQFDPSVVGGLLAAVERQVQAGAA
jgi:diguanylate cyclase (GGDEF)-like protein